MTSFKKIHEMIELHNNNQLKTAIQNHKKFDPHDARCKRNYLYTSVYCNNFEAFQILINHPNFNMKLNKHHNWIILILNKYNNSSIENCRYLDELIKSNILFNPSVLLFCEDIYIVKKIIHNIDKSKPHDLITGIFSNNQSTDIQNYVLEFVFENYPGILFKDFVDSNILHHCISKGKLGIIETLINNDINVKTCLGIPIILIFLTNSKLNLVDFDYYLSKEYFYDENLLDKKWFNSVTYNVFIKITFLANNLETFKKCFKYVKDDLYEFTNLTINSLINKGSAYYLTKNYLEETNVIIHFLINLHKHKNDNFFEKIVGVHTFESIIEPSLASLKPGYNYYSVTSVDKEICKIILGCILFHKYEPTVRFSKVIEKAFKPEELINLDKFKPIDTKTKVLTKGKTKKLNL